MSRIKNWMMTMEELVSEAIESGITSFEEIVFYVKERYPADTNYIRKTYTKMLLENNYSGE